MKGTDLPFTSENNQVWAENTVFYPFSFNSYVQISHSPRTWRRPPSIDLFSPVPKILPKDSAHVSRRDLQRVLCGIINVTQNL